MYDLRAQAAPKFKFLKYFLCKTWRGAGGLLFEVGAIDGC